MEVSKTELKKIIKKFIEITKKAYKENTTRGYTKQLNELIKNKSYKNFKLDASIGIGTLIKNGLPWITFLKKNHKTSKGFYPYLGYDYKNNILYVKLGTSETEEHQCLNINIDRIEQINKLYGKEFSNPENSIEKIVDTLDYLVREYETLDYDCFNGEEKILLKKTSYKPNPLWTSGNWKNL